MGEPGRYERDQKVVIITPANPNVVAFTNDFIAGGIAVPFGVAATLTLTFDGQSVATKGVVPANTGVTFMPDLTNVSEGWYFANVTGLDDSWTVINYPVYVLKGAIAQSPTKIPVTTGSHTLAFTDPPVYQYGYVAARHDPTKVQYPAREYPAFSTIPVRHNLIFTSLVPARPGDGTRPLITKEGVWTTANRENYFYYDFEQGKPMLPMLDGPRGRGSIICPAHLELGTAAPNGTLRGNVYFIESWRFGKVTPDGTVITLAGWRHTGVASYRTEPTTLELVGDWSAIPEGRRGFAQPWGLAWDPRTLVINEAAEPIPTENNDKPHVFGPVAFISDTFNHRVLRLEFSPTSHAVPPKITEFITGLNEPWAIIAEGTRLIVSDRRNNAIKTFDMDSGALVASWPVVQPEGMVLQDGWLYYASVKSKSIRKRNLASGADVLVTDASVPGSNIGYYVNNNARYMHIAVSDGTFGPRGMIAYTTWSNSYYGYPVLIDGATGKMIDWLANSPTFKGTTPPLGSYSSAVAIAHGRMLFGTAEEGLHVVSQALSSDPVVDQAKYAAGRSQWMAKGYHLTHGPGGFGYYGLPPPWGDTPEIDYYLTHNGHVR